MCAKFSFDFSSRNRFKCKYRCAGIPIIRGAFDSFQFTEKTGNLYGCCFSLYLNHKEPHCRASNGFVPTRSLNQSENVCSHEIGMPVAGCSDLLYGNIL